VTIQAMREDLAAQADGEVSSLVAEKTRRKLTPKQGRFGVEIPDALVSVASLLLDSAG
jgi:hypothetical protein